MLTEIKSNWMKGMQPAKCNKFYIGIYQYLFEIYISLSFSPCSFIESGRDVLEKSLSCNFKNGMFNYEHFLYIRIAIYSSEQK